jgi:hypothetical protein
MTKQQREALIAELQAAQAATLADMAARERRMNDPFVSYEPWQPAPETINKAASDTDVVYRTNEDALVTEDEPCFSDEQIQAIGFALNEIRRQLRAEMDDKVAQARRRVDAGDRAALEPEPRK